MQVSSYLKCPWCFYQFNTRTYQNLNPKETTQITCPRCTQTFTVYKTASGDFHTTNNCQKNGHRHNWKYVSVPGYDLWKKCRRCGKEDLRQAQLKLPGMQAITT